MNKFEPVPHCWIESFQVGKAYKLHMERQARRFPAVPKFLDLLAFLRKPGYNLPSKHKERYVQADTN